MFQRRRFTRRAFGFRKPVAKARFFWTTITSTIAEGIAGSIMNTTLLVSSQWQQNTVAGHNERAKIVRCQLVVSATPVATAETRQFMVYHDDAGQAGLDPTLAASYGSTDCVHIGQFYTPLAAATPLFNGFPDGVRNFRVNRLTQEDRTLWVSWLRPVGSANGLSVTMFARVLVKIG